MPPNLRDTDIIMEKSLLRSQLRQVLRSMSADRRARASALACRNLVQSPHFRRAGSVMMFLSFSFEIETEMAIRAAWQAGKCVTVPKMQTQGPNMVPVRIEPHVHDFSIGAAGLRNPIIAEEVPAQSIDLVITPGLGYDRQGNRLGRGGCYYDNFFAQAGFRGHRCGFAFADQLVSRVPKADHDQVVHTLVTDEDILEFSTS